MNIQVQQLSAHGPSCFIHPSQGYLRQMPDMLSSERIFSVTGRCSPHTPYLQDWFHLLVKGLRGWGDSSNL